MRQFQSNLLLHVVMLSGPQSAKNLVCTTTSVRHARQPKQNRRPQPPVNDELGFVYWSCASGLRFRVGRSSSFFVSLPLLSGEDVRRRLGLFPSFWSTTLRRFSITASRAFTSSNSEVVTTYCGRAGRMREISSCDFAMRSGVCGCVAKAFAKVPGFFFSCAWTFSKKEINAFGSYPVLYMYCKPR